MIHCSTGAAGSSVRVHPVTAAACVLQEQASQLLAPAVECLTGAHAMPVCVCACRAVSQLLPRAAASAAQPHLHRVYSALIDLMGHADQDVLNLILQTLKVRAPPNTRMLTMRRHRPSGLHRADAGRSCGQVLHLRCMSVCTADGCNLD